MPDHTPDHSPSHTSYASPPTDATLSRAMGALLGIGFVGLACALVGLAYLGIESRNAAIAQMKDTAAERAVPTVNAVPVKQANNIVSLDLPGRLEPYMRADLFARVSGYVASWKYDIGAKVKSGDVLAEIDAPDLDQQLFQSQSDLANAKVNARLSDLTNQRYQALTPGTAVSRQTVDEKAADSEAKQALVKSAQANVDRLLALAQYKKVVAPFDGIVTARNTDMGALIAAGQATGSPMFVVANVERMRLYINVPQNYAPLVKVGTNASVTVPEHPGRAYDAKIEAISGAVDPAAGTSRFQLMVDNGSGELLAGGYASVSLKLPNTSQPLTIPASALIFDKEGLRVAVVNAEGIAQFKKVTISRDLGKVIEIGSGLQPADLVIESPPDGLVEGDKVRLKAAEPKTGPA